MEAHFKPGVHLDVFTSPAELKQKIDFYLNNKEQRATIAAAGWARVQRFGRDSWAAKIVETIEGYSV